MFSRIYNGKYGDLHISWWFTCKMSGVVRAGGMVWFCAIKLMKNTERYGVHAESWFALLTVLTFFRVYVYTSLSGLWKSGRSCCSSSTDFAAVQWHIISTGHWGLQSTRALLLSPSLKTGLLFEATDQHPSHSHSLSHTHTFCIYHIKLGIQIDHPNI